MSIWPSTKAKVVFRALIRAGWYVKRQGSTSHLLLARSGGRDFVWAFHHGDEIGPKMLSRIAKRTGLKPENL